MRKWIMCGMELGECQKCEKTVLVKDFHIGEYSKKHLCYECYCRDLEKGDDREIEKFTKLFKKRCGKHLSKYISVTSWTFSKGCIQKVYVTAFGIEIFLYVRDIRKQKNLNGFIDGLIMEVCEDLNKSLRGADWEYVFTPGKGDGTGGYYALTSQQFKKRIKKLKEM